MQTFKIEIQNQDVVDKVLWLLDSLKGEGISISKLEDEFTIDTQACLSTLEKEDKDFKEISSSKLFEALDI